MVAEEKYSIIFEGDILVRSPAGTFTFKAQTRSLPIVLLSHGKQEPSAAATIFWDNAFAQEVINPETCLARFIIQIQIRRPYEVPDQVTWAQLITAMSSKWQAECKTTIGLSKRASDYLADKTFGQVVPDDCMVSWHQLSRDSKVCIFLSHMYYIQITDYVITYFSITNQETVRLCFKIHCLAMVLFRDGLDKIGISPTALELGRN